MLGSSFLLLSALAMACLTHKWSQPSRVNLVERPATFGEVGLGIKETKKDKVYYWKNKDKIWWETGSIHKRNNRIRQF